MRAIALFSLVLLAMTIVPGAVAVPPPATPIYPGMGGAPVEILKNMYPCIQGNAVIMDYIGECGVGSWREERMRSGSKVAHLFPANSCGKQLIFFSTSAGERDDPDRVATIWVLNASETWSETMDPVYPDGGTYRIRGLTEEFSKVPFTFISGGVVALILIGLAFALIERRKNPP